MSRIPAAADALTTSALSSTTDFNPERQAMIAIEDVATARSVTIAAPDQLMSSTKAPSPATAMHRKGRQPDQARAALV